MIRLMWSEESSGRFPGRYYQLTGVRPGPRPAHPIGIWVGAYKPRMLRLIGRLADGWVPSLGYLSLDDFAGLNAIIDGAAMGAGRDPASIRRILNVGEGMTADQLHTLAAVHGFDSFVLATSDRAQLASFAGEIAPAVRELVAASRAAVK